MTKRIEKKKLKKKITVVDVVIYTIISLYY